MSTGLSRVSGYQGFQFYPDFKITNLEIANDLLVLREDSTTCRAAVERVNEYWTQFGGETIATKPKFYLL